MENKQSQNLAPVSANENDVTTWALPEGAVARLGRGREPDIALSPDGQLLAIGTAMGFWLYDLETLSPIALWETERGMVFHIAFSPNGKWIAACNSDQTLKVLDIQDGTCLREVKTDDYISGLTFSYNNQYLAAAYARSAIVEVWHAETCEPVAQFTSDTEKAGFYRPISFSPDTQLIASTSTSDTTDDAEVIVVWDMESGQQIASLTAHTYWISSLCFSPCGQFLTSGGEDGTVYVWDVSTWQQVRSYTDFGDVYRIIPSYSPDGILRAAIVNYDDTGPATISVRNLESGEQLYTDKVWGNTVQFSDADDWGNTVVFSNGSQLAYESRHEFINVWTPEHPYRRQFTHSPISFPTSAVFSDDGKTLAVEHHHEGVVLWDIASKRSRSAVKLESTGKNQFVYKTNSGKLYVASIQEDNVRLWEADRDGMPLVEGTGREYWSAFPTLAPTGTLFAYADADGTLKVWDVRNGEKCYELTHRLHEDDEADEDNKDEIRKLAFSPDGSLLASESRFTSVRLWDMERGEAINTFPVDSVGGIIGFSPCGQYLACIGEEILLWDIAHRKLHKTGLNQGPFISACRHYFVCSGDETVLYDLTRREILQQLPLPEESDRIFCAAFSPCERYLAGGAWWQEGIEKVPIYVWEVASGKQLATLRGHPTDVQDLAISPDNSLLASASYDGSILLWDLKSIIGS
ncbi:WD40 repeat domain-containing protein [Candidatus Poribacteria bacterium]|nr:WD40 repeat domain-containing protein [Candidatus Poribacteria bacterium]